MVPLMIGIVLAAHGPLADAFLESTRMILGEQPQVASIALMPGDSLEGLVERLHSAVNEVNTGDGALILLDMFGGTPANAAALLTRQMNDLYAISGINLPMLLETFLARMGEDQLASLAETAFLAGRTGMVDIVEAFKQFREVQEGGSSQGSNMSS
jgi:mannose/fructose/sorbose-specific phosphotransferase system IIA component